MKKVTGNRLPTLKSLRRIVTINANVGKGADIVNAQRVPDPGPLFLMQMSESSQRLKCIYKFLCAMGVFTSLLKMIHKCSELCSEICFTKLPVHSYIMFRTDMCSVFFTSRWRYCSKNVYNPHYHGN